ncbi:MAG: ABC transporter ATP-binding protein [Pseudomonadota bacterium]
MLLDVVNIHKSYTAPAAHSARTDKVLRGVEFKLEAGETLALTGESGSGKSTLMHLIGGLDVPDAGSIMLDGQPVHQLDDKGRAALRRTTIGIIFQQFNLVPSLTVAANIRLQARLAGRLDEAQATDITSALGLDRHVDKYPEALSGGQQQRVAIARALAVRPKLLLADEPTGNLDEATSDAVVDQLAGLTDRHGCALIMVTHSSHLASRLKRRLHLQSGTLTQPPEATR